VTDIEMQWLEEAKTALSFNPNTGIFTWAKSGPKRKVGNIAGYCCEKGYRVICVNKKSYYAHRVAFAWFYERWPNKQIDHINGNKDDNRISNLREASNQQNQANARRRKDNTSGFKGVRRAKTKGKWCAYVYVNGKDTYIGTYDSQELAHQGYAKAASVAFGEFAKPE